MAKLICKLEGKVVSQHTLSRGKLRIGRRQDNDIVVDHMLVSGAHATIELTDSGYVLTDMNSTNGTTVNLKPIRTHHLVDGDTIDIGRYQFVFSQAGSRVGAANQFKANQTQAPSAKPSNQAAPTLRFLSGERAGERIVLNKMMTTIMQTASEVIIITKRHDAFFLSQVEGTQTLTINQKPPAHHSQQLAHKDIIEMGHTQMQFIEADKAS